MLDGNTLCIYYDTQFRGKQWMEDQGGFGLFLNVLFSIEADLPTALGLRVPTYNIYEAVIRFLTA